MHIYDLQWMENKNKKPSMLPILNGFMHKEHGFVPQKSTMNINEVCVYYVSF